MDARDYGEWCDLSGIYLANLSRGDRYRTFSRTLSKAGLNTAIVQDFLNDNHGELNVAAWRTYAVYELGDDQKLRLKLTTDALHAIGADKIAAAVRNAKSYSPFDALQDVDLSNPGSFLDAVKNSDPQAMLNHLRENLSRMLPGMAADMGLTPTPQAPPDGEDGQPLYETRDEVERLLAAYVASHQKSLLDDLRKHGDPRDEPGYSYEARMQELDDARRRQWILEAQREDLQSFQSMMDNIRTRYADVGTLDKRTRRKLEQDRRTFLELVRENRQRAAEHPLPEMTAMLERAEAFIGRHPDVFVRKPTADEELNRRLAAIGDYDVDIDGRLTHVTWDQPEGLQCDWNLFALSLYFPSGNNAVVETFLRMIERLRQRWPDPASVWREELIAHFRIFEAQMAGWEREDYPLGEDGLATDESILQHAGRGTISVYAEEGEWISTSVWFGVEWDQEHGCELEWEDEESGGS